MAETSSYQLGEQMLSLFEGKINVKMGAYNKGLLLTLIIVQYYLIVSYTLLNTLGELGILLTPNVF